MRPVFIYFREAPFNGNNKFVLDFSDEEFVQRVFLVKKQIIVLEASIVTYF